jgi:hypothetical protein
MFDCPYRETCSVPKTETGLCLTLNIAKGLFQNQGRITARTHIAICQANQGYLANVTEQGTNVNR